MKWGVIGFGIGLALAGAVLYAASLPGELINGRTSGGVNIPLQVQSDGTLVSHP